MASIGVANLDSAGFQRAARVYCNTVEAALATLPGGYRLVLMDPPYKLTSLDGALEAIATTAGLLEPGGTVVVGHSKRLSLKQDYEPLEMVSQRRYGDNAVDFYRHEGRLI